ncbi:MAG: agmatine deiminase family protein [Coriobacteriales bacterium]|jgi:agmatine deiminase
MKKAIAIFSVCILVLAGVFFSIYFGTDTERSNVAETYSIPHESEEHEGTWLIWPHQYTYGLEYRNEIEPIWISMTQALVSGEKVHIIAYNEEERERIEEVLADHQIDMTNIDFTIAESDDVWVRDTGPIFAFDENNDLTILNFAFNGWGKKTPYQKDDDIPLSVSKDRNIKIETISDVVIEGGAIESDGAGTLMACRSSVISPNRNPGMSQEEMEKILQQYTGASNFIWLDGVTGEDITDAHIDGIARFYDKNTLLTVSKDDFLNLHENISEEDYKVLQSARNADGEKYQIVEFPLTKNNVKGLDYKGSYLNFYIGNEVVLLPVYQDSNDDKAIEILQELYPDREVVPIDVTALYQYGGMLHCVTQQQPASR